jgi:hypothetical protein
MHNGKLCHAIKSFSFGLFVLPFTVENIDSIFIFGQIFVDKVDFPQNNRVYICSIVSIFLKKDSA